MATFRGQDSPITSDPYPTPDELTDAVNSAAASASAASSSEVAAEAAQTAAETAQTAAETAKTGAETAQTAAETAQTAAETAQTAAETAQTAAETAETNAETAETNAAASETAAANSLASLQNENLVMNPSGSVSQMGDITGLSNGDYPFDRMKWFQVGTMSINSSQIYPQDIPEDSGGIKPDSAMRFTVGTADTSIAAGDYAIVGQGFIPETLEKYYDGQVTLSFYVRSSLTGTFGVAIRSPDAAANFIKEFTISSANTWEKKTVTLTLDTTEGSWTYTTRRDAGVKIFFTLAAGSTFQSTDNQWNTGTFLSTANQSNFVGTASATFDIAAVKLEEGSSASAFREPDWESELERCYLYRRQSYGYGVAPGTVDSSGSQRFRAPGAHGSIYDSSYFGGHMRAVPSLTIYSTVTGTASRVRDVSGAADVTVTSVTIISTTEVGLITLGASTVDGRAYAWQWVAISEVI